ncbi:Predicted transcriptional regulator [Myxococcus fulvus]|uniref:Predicted transcriptional regulator n=1 Tax=Myxococcus fulvus TaxID=33 RepID=A0A511TFN8_MYXFU|nr:BlaI/MecI/CopY family transcriptional regulator [Myxococcus fulvus]AKF80267.1 transcriptional regulator [Myxococcus fulvus 124B02]GEN12975.1 hypothetical protein MFU01_80120 [Myxococcus fulvus]SEU38435.1 Predicted transcriptional regulator [Myxococcus fulvus]
MTTEAIPTEVELAILGVLWKRGPCTVRDVHEALGREDGKSAGYTTTLKQLQVMSAKGLVSRDESSRSHVYAASINESRTKRQLVKDLLERVFGGASGELAVQALSLKPASKEELEDLRQLLDEGKGGKR